MHILVTGADGFIGRHLVQRLLRASSRSGSAYQDAVITVLDRQFSHLVHRPSAGDRLRCITGSFADADILRQALQTPADLVFHLAALPSGLSESNPDLGLAINAHGTLLLLQALRQQDNCPTLVFSSSIAVYGKPRDAVVTDHTAANPGLSYGAHKVIGEMLVHDFVRRGWINGCSIRLPGIVARPAEPNGAVSIFLSDLIRNMASGLPFICPVSAAATSWLMSVQCCIDNLLHAAQPGSHQGQTWMLPCLQVNLQELARTAARVGGHNGIETLLQWQPDPWVEENFGSYPPVRLPAAEAAGFRADANLETLVQGALQESGR